MHALQKSSKDVRCHSIPLFAEHAACLTHMRCIQMLISKPFEIIRHCINRFVGKEMIA
jgi:hypothetical protein